MCFRLIKLSHNTCKIFVLQRCVKINIFIALGTQNTEILAQMCDKMNNIHGFDFQTRYQTQVTASTITRKEKVINGSRGGPIKEFHLERQHLGSYVEGQCY